MNTGEYLTLHRKSKEETTPKSNKKKSSKKPFKKGSWKDWLYRKLIKLRTPSNVSHFHDMSAENLIIHRKSKPNVTFSKRRFTESQLSKLEKRYPDDCYILINCGESMFYRLSLKSYLKLCKIDRMIVNMDLYAEDDYDQGTYVIQEFDRTIYTINDLLHFVIYLRSLIDGVAETQSQMCGFTYHKYKFTTVIISANGKAKAYKGDFNEVLQEYEITPLL